MRTYVASNYRLQEEAEGKPEGDDLCEGFTNNLSGLYQLSFLLTRDHETAERCFVVGLENLCRGNRAFNQWAHEWAKRIIVENAIRELKPQPRPSQSSPPPTDFTYAGRLSSDPGGHFQVRAILGLEDFERFVFVLSVLDHYTPEDCALLLSCSVSTVRDARTRALHELVNAVEIIPHKQALEHAQEGQR